MACGHYLSYAPVQDLAREPARTRCNEKGLSSSRPPSEFQAVFLIHCFLRMP